MAIQSEDKTYYYGEFNFAEVTLYVVVSDIGLCFIGSSESLSKWETKQLEKKRSPNPEKALPYIEQLKAYLAGERKAFDLPFDVQSTDFQAEVWAELQKIPYGQTMTYSEIAHNIGREGADRAVGSAVGSNPLLIVVPCHRVVTKRGKISNYREGVAMKEQLLQLEKANI
ncbi:methylated-DNA--[protein]-cysteine S-methyltransferase [Fundicoccus culcitae]|uniref:Methylated-DNA--[protein]-cysteine S-methyltransferase n=1 Tax=Fundicoccus culcitae TaxID=2969821 RepID=A0ABY5P3K8_9LACT|nr:methylated-DNA--[protein]-cysteine S-methyltransferase [Fundicoccus culcitae]UUX33028.1 methylated-DNA--[protein]-cysteine S-methyltransferase [Fundicoccus culcitae]